MLTEEKVLKDIEKIVQEKLNIELDDEITMDTDFLKDGLGLDSVMVLELIIELELLYEIELDEDELTMEHFQKAALIIKFILEKIAKNDV